MVNKLNEIYFRTIQLPYPIFMVAFFSVVAYIHVTASYNTTTGT